MLTPDPELAVDYGLFTVAQAMAAGFSRTDIDRGVRRGRWDRPARGILREAGRKARAGDELLMAVLCAGPGAVAGFESAAEVHGWDLLKRPLKPKLIVPLGYHAPKTQNASIHRTHLRPHEVQLHGVVPVTRPLQTALDIAASTSLEVAVVILDSAIRSKTVTYAQLQTGLASRERHGVRNARQVLALVDPLSGSIPESQARLLFRQAGLPAPVSQHSFYQDGAFIARSDFYWPWARVVGEIDGFKYHSGSCDFQKDRTTHNALVRAGLTVVRFTVTDLWTRQDYVTSCLREVLGLAGGYESY